MIGMRGSFICLEGIDGSGKTTQAKLLVEKLRLNFDSVYTAEPSDGKVGSFIRNSYLYGENRLSGVIEALLFAADRVEHVENEVIPALSAGKIVVSDRYIYSSLAYQGAAGLNLEWIEQINQYSLRPDLGIFVDVAPETALKRLKSTRSVMETLETQEKVRQIYLQFVEKDFLKLINGNRSKDLVAKDIYSAVLRFLNSRG